MTKKSVALQKRSNTSLQKINQSGRSVNAGRRITARRRLTPAVDVIESPEEITVIADMPGIEKENLDVSIERDMLKIGGFRDVPHPQNYRPDDPSPEFERLTYHREFRIGEDINREKITATYRQGVLRVVLPRTQNARPRRIEVKGE